MTVIAITGAQRPACPIKSRCEPYNRKKDMMRDYNVRLKDINNEKEHKEEGK